MHQRQPAVPDSPKARMRRKENGPFIFLLALVAEDWLPARTVGLRWATAPELGVSRRDATYFGSSSFPSSGLGTYFGKLCFGRSRVGRVRRPSFSQVCPPARQVSIWTGDPSAK